jgi:hypothetical protein
MSLILRGKNNPLNPSELGELEFYSRTELEARGLDVLIPPELGARGLHSSVPPELEARGLDVLIPPELGARGLHSSVPPDLGARGLYYATLLAAQRNPAKNCRISG